MLKKNLQFIKKTKKKVWLLYIFNFYLEHTKSFIWNKKTQSKLILPLNWIFNFSAVIN